MAGYAGADVSDLIVAITMKDGSEVRINISFRSKDDQTPEVCGAPVESS